MILVITHKEDYTADYLINQLNKKAYKYLRLNCEDLLLTPSFSINDTNNFETLFDFHNEISSVWFRRTQVPKMDGLNQQERHYFNAEFDSLLENIYCSLEDKKWLSNPFDIFKAENKILQLKLAQRIGLKIPRTLITNSRQKIIDFYNGNKKTVIKPINSGYVANNDEVSLFFTNTLNDNHINTIEDFDLTPCIFQEYTEKEYELRVTVVDGHIFTARVDSQEVSESIIDWRRSKLKFKEEQIPKNLQLMCLEMCKSLNLNFGAFDFIKNAGDDGYTFLEVNPNGQWAWIEMETELKISNAIINYLTK